MRGRSAIESVIGHLKYERRMNRNYLADSRGDLSKSHPRRRRLQIPAPDQVAEDFMALILMVLCAQPRPLPA
jgi:hypothetical protein